MPNSALLQDIHVMLRNLSDLDFNLSRSLKVKCNRTNGLPIYASVLMFNSNMWPNSAPLQDIRLQNLSDLDFDLSRSLKVKCDGVIGLCIYGFLLMYIVTICLSHRFALIATRNAFCYLLPLGPNYAIIANAPMTPPNDLERHKVKGTPFVFY